MSPASGVDMLDRLEPPAIAAHAASIAERLAHPDDEQVRLAVVKVLGRAPPSILAAHASELVVRLSDDEPAVRWAVVDALSRLEADTLAPLTLSAVDALMAQRDVSIARAAVAQWAPKLSAQHQEVISALNRLSAGQHVEQED